MNLLLHIQENSIHMAVEKTAAGTLHLLHLSPEPFQPASVPENEEARDAYNMVEIHRSGESSRDVHGNKHCGSGPGGDTAMPIYLAHRDTRTPDGRKLEFVQAAGTLKITSTYQFFDGLPVLRCQTEVENTGADSIPLEYVASFTLTGLTKDSTRPWDEISRVHLPFNSWMEEMQWQSFSLPELGVSRMSSSGFSMQRIAVNNTGSHGAKEKMPIGIFENSQNRTVYAWQIETHGSWAWEIADRPGGQLYLQLSGPTERENFWFKNLRPGEKFTSIPVAVVIQQGQAVEAFQTLNEYRRRIRHFRAVDRELPVVFNDFMNCLMADPTTERELPLIDRAAKLGAEYYVIDAGWYADGPWWDTVGEWQPVAERRFPHGLKEVLDHIVARGMKPGLWLELERMGKNCPLAKVWPEECFFRRHGRRVMENHSYQLDFRHPVVRRHADDVVARLVAQLDVHYIKMDYNIEIGPGTEIDADSFGDGLLQHQRAYLDWLDAILAKYPELLIENCSSGGLRNTYSMLSRLSLCSTTDNQNYLQNARISINCASSYCMEQAGVWVYPLAAADEEEVAMNMVSALSWRPYLSGQIQALSQEKLDLIRQGVELYQKDLRQVLPQAVPDWPLGLVDGHSAWGVFALRTPGRIIVSVWRFEGGADQLEIPLVHLPGTVTEVKRLYPLTLPVEYRWQPNEQLLCVSQPEKSARMFELRYTV